jgi:hypothetical protein
MIEILKDLDPVLAASIGALGGFLVRQFGGKVIPLLRAAAKSTPSKADDAAVEVLQAAVDAEAKKDK